MREKLNDNPLAQLVIIGVLLLAAGFFVMSSMGRGGEASKSAGTAEVPAESSTEVPTSVSAALTGVKQATAGAAKPLPKPVNQAWHSDQTVVLLFVRPGGIDDALVADATKSLAALPGVAAFVVPASEVSRYAAITEGVGVDRVPALVVVRPKRLEQTLPTASVSYGFQSGQSVIQAVVDAGYKGPTLSYHP